MISQCKNAPENRKISAALEKINLFLSGLPMTVLGGIFLLASLTLPWLGVNLPADPAWITVIICGIPLVYLSLWRILHNPGISKISSALLISIAMAAAIALGDLFAAGEVAFIMALGAILEEMTTKRAKKGLTQLINLAPAQGRRLADGKEELIPAEQIQKGDILRVLPGETIPADGRILRGQTSVDQSVMTGESLPVDKEAGEEVFCGTTNCFGSIDLVATKVGEDSSLQKLIQMIQDAENKQAPMQRIADKWASWLVPVALSIAIIAYLATGNIVTAVTILVVFCPCALVLAMPTAIMAAIGQATKHGVIIKSGEALEKMGKVDTIAFDKTGTLTYGRLHVSDILSCAEGRKDSEILALAASVEAKSEHPLGKAVVACARERELSLLESTEFRMEAGRGVSAVISEKSLVCGNESYLKEAGIPVPASAQNPLNQLRQEGKAIILVAENGVCIGIIALSDTLRPQSENVISQLEQMGIKTVLLTGDNRQAADFLGKKTGIEDIRSQLLPAQKVDTIAALQKEGRMVCMTGDGINDAPALKTADVSVAMGEIGSDITVNAADIVLMNDDITRLPYLKRLSNATVKTIKASISLSMTINFIAILLSLLEVLNPTTGALVHNAGSCFVVLIAALLYDRKFE